MQKSDGKDKTGTESNQNHVFFVEPRNSKIPEKNSSKRRSELLLKSNETKEPTSEVVVREILPQETKYPLQNNIKLQ
jgi:hypothetical protein